MADTELEALNEIITQNETIISNQDSIIIHLSDLVTSSAINDTTNLTLDQFIIDIDEHIIKINQDFNWLHGVSGEYTEEELQANNTALYNDISQLKDIGYINFAFMGIVISAVLVLCIVKGFFKNVSS